MAETIAIVRKIPLLKWLISLILVSFFVVLYFTFTYDHLTLISFGPVQPTFQNADFMARSYNISNTTLQLYGSYVTTGQREQKLDGSLDLKPEVIERMRRKYIKAKTREFEKMSRPIKVPSVNCRALFDNDEDEIERVKKKMEKQKRQQKSPELYIELTQKCNSFKRKRGYITKALSAEEESFPIAFSVLLFKDVEQVDRLFRAIYRPHNYYCVHIDTKTTPEVRKAMQGIVECLDNVFITSRAVDVQWGSYTVLEPEIICLKELWKYKKWKYFINLTGQEFPLKTNFELVKILKAYNGANDMEGTVKRANKGRWEKAGPPPHNITALKGSVHIAVNRAFVDYVLHNQTALDFLEWVKNVGVPDETYFTSLNHNRHLGVPGSYLGEPETDRHIKPFLTRFKNWGNEPFDWPCAGQRVRLICIFGVGDLPLLRSRPEMFANKFYWDYEPYTLDCMEELHYNKTRDEFVGTRTFDDSFYKTLSFVKNKIPV